MLTFFTDPYDDELISSIFARYHLYSGNIDKNDTIEELQGERNIIAFTMFPSRLNFLASQIDNHNYTADQFIYKNTIFPLYSVFLSKNKHNIVINYMKEKGSDKIYHNLGISTSKIDKRKGYRYCPLCAAEEVNLYGEVYFHRMHQVQGVLVCEKHECRLLDYEEEYKSEIEFTRFEYENVQIIKKPIYYEKNINKVLVQIARAVKYIIQLEYLKYSREYVLDKLYKLLDSKDYLTINGGIKQTALTLDFKNYYEEKLLVLLNSQVNLDKSDWIRSIFTKARCSSQPIRTILLILFLTNNQIDKFFCETKKEELTFGEGPWPCLNPICDFYKKNIINTIKIEKAYKSRLHNGIFKCKYCGYTYRRKGPDKDIVDIYIKDKVLEFGPLWEKEFKKAVQRNDKKKDIKERFEVYDRFIDYYKKNNSFIPRDHKTKLGNTQDNFEKYTNNIKEYMKKNSKSSKSDIMKHMSKEVGWLRYNYPEWLQENLPKASTRKNYSKKKDYKEFDDEMVEKVKNVYEQLIVVKKNRRITITLIERLLNEKINRKIDRLPKTKAFLQEILENVDQYSIRRVREYCNELLEKSAYIARYDIINRTAISRKLISNECKKEIDEIIIEYHRKLFESSTN